jgi:stress response protein YsnF
VERKPSIRAATNQEKGGDVGKDPFQEEHIEVPIESLSREEPVVEKETWVTGSIRIRKTEDVDIDESSKASDSHKGQAFKLRTSFQE